MGLHFLTRCMVQKKIQNFIIDVQGFLHFSVLWPTEIKARLKFMFFFRQIFNEQICITDKNKIMNKNIKNLSLVMKLHNLTLERVSCMNIKKDLGGMPAMVFLLAMNKWANEHTHTKQTAGGLRAPGQSQAQRERGPAAFHWLTVEDDASGGDRLHAGDRAQQGRFSRAVGTDKGDDFAAAVAASRAMRSSKASYARPRGWPTPKSTRFLMVTRRRAPVTRAGPRFWTNAPSRRPDEQAPRGARLDRFRSARAGDRVRRAGPDARRHQIRAYLGQPADRGVHAGRQRMRGHLAWGHGRALALPHSREARTAARRSIRGASRQLRLLARHPWF